MSLTLTTNFVEQENLVVPLAQSAGENGLAIRVASNGSGTLGTLIATGAQSAPITWTLAQNPTWVSMAIDPTTLIATLLFINARAQTNPTQFYITATDGVTTQNFPVFLEVRDPLTIQGPGAATSFNVPSYNSAVADIVFHGIGLGGTVDADVSFIPPPVLPAGMKFITSDGSSMKLRVQESSTSNVAGGITLYSPGGVSMQVTLEAYKEGTLYDNPSRCARVPIMIQSASAVQGVVDLALALQYNLSTNAFEVSSFLDFLSGEAPAVTYEWMVEGTATGTVLSGGTSTATSMSWAPSSTGTVGFTLNVLNASTSALLAQVIIAPVKCAVAGSWEATNAVKVSLSPADARGYAGSTQDITISTPASELAGGETITVNLTAAPAGSVESTATLTAATVTLTASAPSATIALALPTSGVNQKWVVTAQAENATSSPTRTGFAQGVFLSSGTQPMTVTTALGTSLTSNVGESITPIALVAENAESTPVTGAVFSLCGAPDGLLIEGGTLTGNVLVPGSYTFTVAADAVGYARSYSTPITLVASAYFAPLMVTGAVPSVTALPDNQQFNVSWGYAGSPLTLNIAQGFNIRSVLGTTSTTLTEVGSSVITIYGASFYGDAYSIPALVLSSSVVESGDLQDAPTIGTIDENYNLVLQWNPAQVDGSYSAYAGWDIWLKELPSGMNEQQTVNGVIPTGLEPIGATPGSRLFKKVVTSGDWQVSMQAITANTALAQDSAGWDAPHEFPTAITDSSVAFDNASISLGQTLTMTLDPDYIGADLWQAIYPDGTTSGWLPISVKTLAKSFNVAGTLPIVFQTVRNFSTANPPVKLIRQVTQNIVVMNQQYNGTPTSTILTGDLGIGGEVGFEITNASNAAVALVPYEVIIRALVRDVLTNELKLMVATSRTNDASSLLGTLALDVFPLAGRPREIARINPALYLSAEQAHQDNPPSINTTTLPTLIVGQPMNDFPIQLVPNTGVAPFIWYADGLPDGVRLSTNGTLSGTPSAVGSFTLNVAVMDSNTPPFIAHTTLTLAVVSNLAIQNASLPNAVTGTAYRQNLVALGGLPPYTWTVVSGKMPIGPSLDPNSGNIAGTPVVYDSLTAFSAYEFTVQVVDAIGSIASGTFSITLTPATLQLGNLDQTQLFVGEDFNLTVPVFGGQPPYVLSVFTDDGTIGSGLRVASPERLAVVAGATSATLEATTGNQTFFPQSYPFTLAFQASVTGGSAPYTFRDLNATLPDAEISGPWVLGSVTEDGTYSIQLQCADSLGNLATQTVQITSQLQNGGPYTILPVTVNFNGSTNPADWTVTLISNLPDAAKNQSYSPGSGVYYGLGLYNNGVAAFSHTTPVNFTINSGAVPAGMLLSSANGYDAGTEDYSGLMLFSISGGQVPTTNGSFSFVAEFLDITQVGFPSTQVANRFSVTVTTAGGGTTPAVVMTSTEAATFNLAQADSSGNFYYPLWAEGGVVGVHSFVIGSGTTLPGVSIETWNGGYVLVSNCSVPGSYVAVISSIDSAGNTSAPVTIPITIVAGAAQPIHIVSSNLPTYIYENRPLPVNTYYVESDLVAAWAATGLPSGVSVRQVSGTFGYFEGTPTQSGTFNATITATSLAFNSSAAASVALQVRPQAATFIGAPYAAVVNAAYKASTNNAIVEVQYTGYQPGDIDLPIVASTNGSIGVPGVLSSGVPTTSVSSVTADGFIMSFDYSCSIIGADALVLGSGLAETTVTVAYPQLVVTGNTVALSVSEYSAAANVAFPVSASGGLAPYTISALAFSDPRFSSSGGQVLVDVAELTPGQTTACTIQMQVTDSASHTITVNGILQITVNIEDYDSITFANGTWAVNVSSGTPFFAQMLPNQTESVPVLGHPPYQFYVDAVTLPTGLGTFVKVSPSKRVWAIQFNNTSTSAVVSDAGSDLNPAGNFTAAAVGTSAAPTPGTYQISATLRVVDADGISTSQVVTTNLVIS